MGRLYLECRLCGRKQADGLISRAAWGYVSVEAGRFAGVVSACPGCKSRHPDWEERLRATAVARSGGDSRGAAA